MNSQPIHAFKHVTVDTVYGPKNFTDITFVWHGEFYGNRYYGLIGKQEMAALAQSFIRRRQSEGRGWGDR